MKWVATLGAAAVTIIGVRYLIKNTSSVPHHGRRNAPSSVSTGSQSPDELTDVGEANLKGWKVVIGVEAVGRFTEGKFVIFKEDADELVTLAEDCDLYFVMQIEDDTDKEDLVRAGMARIPFAKPFPSHRLLFCSTEIGKKAIYRQLLGSPRPAIAVDSSLPVAIYLQPHVSHVCFITPTPEVPTSVIATTSLHSYFALLRGEVN
eukprot:TRINITY_DN1363_c3_g1_i1.p1 TRINITY_DN1363_c3_g1~~TRINITY_DN1363_c3_g1_i1.p1  ORF type:complete len:219 (+),score=24.09 TRINITY_DN1363_c3_g1_i1:45-659(+)